MVNRGAEALIGKLKKFPQKRIDLDELKDMCVPVDEYREIISELTSSKVLRPVKSSRTDGNLKMPLYLRYNIMIGDEPEISADEIYRLHPRLTANGFLLHNRKQFVCNKRFLVRLSEWMTEPHNTVKMSRRERSFNIFGEEKMLDENLQLVRNIGLNGDILCCYETPEMCFSDYIPERKADMTLLICENKDIWFNIRLLMYENGFRELFGTALDGVIFGQGNDITGSGKFVAYYGFLGADNVKFLYCGDIDRAGFDIFTRFKNEAGNLDISLFLPAYAKMLELARSVKIPDSADGRDISLDMTEILPLFTQDEQEQITGILSQNKRLPQEILSYPVLAENMR